MELNEMIKVMQHYENGGEVELKSRNTNSIEWEVAYNPNWHWGSFDYRIKKPKIIIEEWLCLNFHGDFVVMTTSNIDGYVYHKKVKLLKTYEVEL